MMIFRYSQYLHGGGYSTLFADLFDGWLLLLLAIPIISLEYPSHSCLDQNLPSQRIDKTDVTPWTVQSRKIPVCIVLKEKCLIWKCFFFTEDMSEEIHSGWLTKSPGSKKVTIFANNITLPIKAVSCSINTHNDNHSKASAKGTRSTRNVYSFVISAICSSFLKNISICYQSRSLQISYSACP